MILGKRKYLYCFFIGGGALLFMWLFIFKNISGVYIANDGIGTDTLRIFTNHTYIRICYPTNDSIHYIDTGKWEVSNGNISFYNWHDRNGRYQPYLNGSFIFGTEMDRSWLIGRRRLLIDDDMGYYYIKDSWWW